mgnify:CR=1 FL=1
MSAMRKVFDGVGFSRALGAARAAKAMSYADVARVCGMSRQNVFNFEANKYQPGARHFLALCEWMGVDPRAYLVSEK